MDYSQYATLPQKLAAFPPEWPEDLRPMIRERVRASARKVVVLDDDPTGTQTVHDIPVLTEWPVEALRSELSNDVTAFYLLTNSRSLPPAAARSLNLEIGRRLREAAAESGRHLAVVSRSDSTLRGHFPDEVEGLAEGLGGSLTGAFDGWLIVPFFLEGGRYTIDNIHYVAEGEHLVPAGETPFARDSAFGYRSSDLREWVAEKTSGRVPANEVAAISLDDLRLGGPDQVARRLAALREGRVCIVNAASYRDLEVFVSGLLEAEAAGRRFLYRTAASFVQVRAGLAPRPLLRPAEVILGPAGPGVLSSGSLPHVADAISPGGLIVVGSYVPRTTGQLSALLARPGIAATEIDVEALLDPVLREGEIARVAGLADAALRAGRDVAVYTGRRLVTVPDVEASLAIGRQVSDGLVAILHHIPTRPRFLIAKGGITSSDVATRGLGVRRAIVRGQILPGVPVWELGSESRYPGLAYVVFPGNVGGEGALAELVDALRAQPGA